MQKFELHPERERKHRRRHCALQRKHRFHGADLAGIHAAHLSRADADGLAVARIENGIRLHMLANFPGEQQRALFFWRGLARW